MKGIKEKLMVGGMILVLIFIFFSACKKSTNPTMNLDQEAILSLVATDTTSFPKEIVQSDSSGFPKIAAVDTVKLWWRKVDRVARKIDVSIYSADSTHTYPYAYVTVTDTAYGHLQIIGRDSSGNPMVLSKPLEDLATKSAYFVKTGFNTNAHRGWSLQGVSGLLIHSVINNTRVITSVNISGAGKNLTLQETDITRITPIDSILTFHVGDSVSLTVTTGDPLFSDSVYLHTLDCHIYTYNCKPHREDFESLPNGTFTLSAVIGDEGMGRRHAAVDVIKHTSLDGSASDPYDSRIWGVLYRVVP